jgi:hypothetical protein
MTEKRSETPTREQRVDEVIAAYLEAERTGQAPDPQELLARHPDLGAELRSFFADRARFEKLVAPLAPGAGVANDHVLPPGQPGGIALLARPRP